MTNSIRRTNPTTPSEGFDVLGAVGPAREPRGATGFTATNVSDVLADRPIPWGVPADIRPDDGSGFASKAGRGWIDAVGAKTATVEPGRPWENGDRESFDPRFCDALLNGGIVRSPRNGRIVTERWRRHTDTKPLRSEIIRIPPAPEVRRTTLHVRQARTLAHYGPANYLHRHGHGGANDEGRSVRLT